MRVTREPDGFRKVTVVIETAEEADQINECITIASTQYFFPPAIQQLWNVVKYRG